MPDYSGLAYDYTTQAEKVEVVGSSNNSSTQRVTGGGPASGQAIISVGGNLVTTSNGAAMTIDTVSAGKSFYITDFSFSSNTTTALDVTIQFAGTVKWEGHISVTDSMSLTSIDSFPAAPAGTVVRIYVNNSAASSSLNYYAAGFEQ